MELQFASGFMALLVHFDCCCPKLCLRFSPLFIHRLFANVFFLGNASILLQKFIKFTVKKKWWLYFTVFLLDLFSYSSIFPCHSFRPGFYCYDFDTKKNWQICCEEVGWISFVKSYKVDTSPKKHRIFNLKMCRSLIFSFLSHVKCGAMLSMANLTTSLLVEKKC